jgi:hypothetical protein
MYKVCVFITIVLLLWEKFIFKSTLSVFSENTEGGKIVYKNDL